jgi:hypothetical protein
LIEETEQGVPWHSLGKVRRWNARNVIASKVSPSSKAKTRASASNAGAEVFMPHLGSNNFNITLL